MGVTLRGSRVGRALGHASQLTEQSVTAFFGDRCPQFAAAISYYALLSIFPAAIAMTAIFGLVVSNEEAQAKVVDFLFDALPLSEGEGVGNSSRSSPASRGAPERLACSAWSGWPGRQPR
jgi:uncharacterized BrkB/YihY/UPF0761 family membrane protein